MKFVKIIFIFFPAVVLILSFRCVTHFNVQNFTEQASVLTTYGLHTYHFFSHWHHYCPHFIIKLLSKECFTYF